MTLDAYLTGVSESIPKNAPESDFADPPKGLYVGDAHHVPLAVQAVTSGFRGNKAEDRSKPGVKSKIESAIKKFYKGAEQRYYLTWLHTGKRPEERPAHEMASLSLALPSWSFSNSPDMPDIPPAPGVDLAKLTEKDPDPFFITRPIAILGGVSDNGLRYDEFLLNELERKTVGKVARNGHIAEENKLWQNPDSVGIWVGVLRVNNDPKYGADTLYGKCYLFPGTPFWTEAKAKEAVGGEISNSIWAPTTLVVDNPDGTWRIVHLPLESIDFIPPERAALEALGGEFKTTSEMKTGVTEMAGEHEDAAADLALFKKAVASIKPEDVHEMLHEAGHAHHVAESHFKAHEMGKCSERGLHEMLSIGQRKGVAESHLKESTPEETYAMLPAAHRKHVAEAYARETGMNMVAQEAATVHESALHEMSSLKQNLAAMEERTRTLEATNAKLERESFNRTLDDTVAYYLDWPVKTDSGKEDLAAYRKNFRTQVVAEMKGSTKVEDIKTAAATAWPDFKPLAEIGLAKLTGPNAFFAGNQGAGDKFGFNPQTGRYSDEAVAEAVAKTNILNGREGGAK